jgi:hypothetical protein
MNKIKAGVNIPKAPMGHEQTQAFQGGGIIDEDTLFEDIDPIDGEPPADGALAGELVGDTPPVTPAAGVTDLGNQTAATAPIDDDPDVDPDLPADPPADIIPTDTTLTGIEQFLSGYGVQGGMITYEDGTSARFEDLEAAEQATILSSLVSESAPSIEEKYNLEDTEIDLLNNVRESGSSVEDFINNLVDYRVKTIAAQQQMQSEDFKGMTDDAVFVRHYVTTNPEATDDQIAQELVKARDLTSFAATTGTIRNAMINAQEASQYENTSKENALFNQELEAQRGQVVEAVEQINDIAGARVTDEMKEFLLGDIMELNDNKDPILMEKIFGTPEDMFEASWFKHYGKDYITNLNAYYKKEISRARKAGYEEATGGMPGSPTIIAGGGKGKNNPGVPQGGPGVNFGKELTEEELFDLDRE